MKNRPGYLLLLVERLRVDVLVLEGEVAVGVERVGRGPGVVVAAVRVAGRVDEHGHVLQPAQVGAVGAGRELVEHPHRRLAARRLVAVRGVGDPAERRRRAIPSPARTAHLPRRSTPLLTPRQKAASFSTFATFSGVPTIAILNWRPPNVVADGLGDHPDARVARGRVGDRLLVDVCRSAVGCRLLVPVWKPPSVLTDCPLLVLKLGLAAATWANVGIEPSYWMVGVQPAGSGAADAPAETATSARTSVAAVAAVPAAQARHHLNLRVLLVGPQHRVAAERRLDLEALSARRRDREVERVRAVALQRYLREREDRARRSCRPSASPCRSRSPAPVSRAS